MVAVEGVGECAEREPSRVIMLVSDVSQSFCVGLPSAESLGDIASEATDIGSDHRNLVKTGHLQNLRDREAVLEPLGEVVYEFQVSHHFRAFIQYHIIIDVPPSQ